MQKALTIITWILQIGHLLQVQAQAPIFEPYKAESLEHLKGLNSFEVTALCQDSSGFIWIGNKPGVSRFNGEKLTNFTKAGDQFIGQIFSIVQGSDQTVWAGGVNGLFYLQEGQFYPAKISNLNIRGLHFGKQGELWVVGLGFVPFSLSISDQEKVINEQAVSITPVVGRKSWEQMMGNFRVWAVDTDPDGNTWFGLDNKRTLFNGNELQVHWKDTTVIHKYSAIAAYGRDSVFWGSETTPTIFQGKDREYRFMEPAAYLFVKTDTALYLLSYTQLLRFSDNGLDTLHTFTTYSHLYFRSMLLDREGNFWIGASHNFIKLSPRKFQTWSVKENPLLESNFSVAELPNGQIMVGSSGGRLLINQENDFVFYDRFDIPGTSLVGAVHVLENKLFFGTSMSGILLKDIASLQQYTTADGLADNGQYFFYRSRKNELWCGGDGGISRISLDAKGQVTFDNYMASWPGIDEDFPIFNSIVEGPDGQVWAASDKGLYRITNGQLEQRFFPSPINSRPIISQAVVIDQKQLWLSTQGEGLWQLKFSAQNEPELVRQWGPEDGLLSNVLLNIHIDKDKKIWVLGHNGVCCIDLGKNQATVNCFDEQDGWLSGPTSSYDVVESKEGLLWAVGFSHINAFPLYELPKNKTVPTAYITEVQLFGGKEDIYQYCEKPKARNQLPQNLVLPHSKNFLRFHFTTTSFTNPEQNKFKVKLEGLNPDYSEIGNDHSILYSGLSPGSYSLKVLSANNDGIWGENPAIYSFRIQPPIWARWWAKVGYGILTVLSIAWIYRFQLSRKLAIAENERLEQVNQVRSNLFANITHEFRTPLTVILGLTSQLKKEEQQPFTSSLEIIERNGQELLELINQMLDLSKLEAKHLALNPIQGDIVAYLEYLFESFSSLAEQKGIKMKLSVDSASLLMDYDPKVIRQIFTNMLSNAIKYTSTAGRVFVEIKALENPDVLIVQVRDTGQGIPEEALLYVFDRYYRVKSKSLYSQEGTGIGLALTKELVELLGGSIEVDSQLGIGTTFGVKLPIFKNAVLSENSKDIVVPVVNSTPEVFSNFSSNPLDLPIVLIIEDNTDVANYMHQILRHVFHCRRAENGKKGLEMAFDLIPDLIICDVMMPEMDGYEVCDHLKTDERTNHIPLIMLTAKVGEEDRLIGLSKGADAYLAKPFGQEALLLQLRNLLHTRQKSQKKYGQDLRALKKERVIGPFLQKVERILNEHMESENFSLDDLAGALHLSRSQVYRKIKALTGESTSIYIRLLRLQKARELLSASELTISEIAYRTGFKSPVYFSQVFKKTFGKSPTESREKE